MGGRVLSVARVEFLIALRNRWVLIATLMMTLFALVLSAAGAMSDSNAGVDRLSLTVASLTALSVYLVPLLALLISFDSVAGEVERGTLPLHLAYPLGRGELLAGKLAAQALVLALAVAVGFGSAAALAFQSAGWSAFEGLAAFIRLLWTSALLGVAFLALGLTMSCLTRRPSSAAGLAVALWLVFVVLYDLGLLAVIVADDGGALTTRFLPWLLLANPADAFRLYNLAASEAVGAATGLAGAARSIEVWKPLASLVLWSVAATVFARLAFGRVQP